MRKEDFAFLKRIVKDELVDGFADYCLSLPENSCITVKNITDKFGVPAIVARMLLHSCTDAKLLHIEYAIRCPLCKNLIIDWTPAEKGRHMTAFCPHCQKDVGALDTISIYDIETTYMVEH